jgi:hypothetical protein
VRALYRTWFRGAELYQRAVERKSPPREDLVRRFAPGRTFADLGCMWRIDGAIAFLAEESGASEVTGLDTMAPTAPFQERLARGSQVRFVRGDLHDPDVAAQVGPHDVVWCWGLLYHSPHPMLILEHLRTITRELLILGTETMPQVPGLSQACVFFPELSDPDRRVHAAARRDRPALGLTSSFDPGQRYGNWWWGISSSALAAMLRAAGFQVLEMRGGPLHRIAVAAPA